MNLPSEDTLDQGVSGRAIRLVSGLAVMCMLLPGLALGQPEGAERPPWELEDPRIGDGPLVGEDPVGKDLSPTGDDCEHRRNEECKPIWAVLGVIIAEYLPQLTDGVRMSYGRMLGGSTYGGRLEWTLDSSKGRRLALGAGVQVAPNRALRLGEKKRALRPSGRDGVFSITLGGSVPAGDLGLWGREALRVTGEATALLGDPGRQLRLTIGPRYRLPVGPKTLAVDLVAGTNLGPRGFAPRVGLRIGWSWD